MQKLIFAFLVAVAVCLVAGPLLIPMLRRLKFGQSEREDGPQSHLKKAGTPTMGGIMMIIAVIVATIPFGMGAMELALPALMVATAFGLVGFLDDFLKVRRKNTVGLRAYQKIIAQLAIAAIIAVYAYRSPYIGSAIYLPFTGAEWELGPFYIPFVMFVVVAMVNSVNLTDGLDGLASGVSLIYSMTMAVVFMYLAKAASAPVEAGQARLTQYAAELSSMAVFSCAVAGACLGFLRFNAYPARVFMGDTGSLALGGALAMMSIFSRAVLLLPIMGACFVASAVSVIIQVGSFKLTRRRVFKMAPLHHHFELKGHPETRIVSVYMIITALLCTACLLAFV